VKTRSLYGYDPGLPPFSGKEPEEQVALLQSWGCSGIFGGYESTEFLEAAHSAGLEVFAEFGCFVGKRWWDQVPESRPIDAKGRALEPEGWYCGVNPSVPEVRDALLADLERTLERHAIDGIWLDFIRWPCHWEVPEPVFRPTSFDRGTLERFQRDSLARFPTDVPERAAEAIRAGQLAEWHAWRCDQITSWVAKAKEIVRRARPNAVLGLFGVPWRRTDYSSAIIDIVGQDYAALGPYVDVFSPMLYHAMCGFPVGWIGEVVDEIASSTGKPVWPILQSVGEPVPLPTSDYASALALSLGHAATDGVVVFTLKGVLEEGKLAATVTEFCASASEQA
jgi:hypothetical protein